MSGWERVTRANTLQWDIEPTTNKTDKAAQNTETNRGSNWPKPRGAMNQVNSCEPSKTGPSSAQSELFNCVTGDNNASENGVNTVQHVQLDIVQGPQHAECQLVYGSPSVLANCFLGWFQYSGLPYQSSLWLAPCPIATSLLC